MSYIKAGGITLLTVGVLQYFGHTINAASVTGMAIALIIAGIAEILLE